MVIYTSGNRQVYLQGQYFAELYVMLLNPGRGTIYVIHHQAWAVFIYRSVRLWRVRQ